VKSSFHVGFITIFLFFSQSCGYGMRPKPVDPPPSPPLCLAVFVEAMRLTLDVAQSDTALACSGSWRLIATQPESGASSLPLLPSHQYISPSLPSFHSFYSLLCCLSVCLPLLETGSDENGDKSCSCPHCFSSIKNCMKKVIISVY
jgi:hypothetical protein